MAALTFAGFSWVVNPVIQGALGWVALFAVLGLFLAPIKDVWGPGGVYQQKSTKNLATGIPYFATLFNCLLWTVYAFMDLPRLLQPFVINAIGLVLFTSFAACYYKFVEDKREAVTAFVAGCLVTAFCAVMTMQSGSFAIFGTSAAVVNVVMYYSPLAAVGEVMRTRSVATMPFLPLLMTFIGSSLWFSYGLYILEWPCVIPNALGIIFGIAQLAIYAHYSKIEAAEGSAAASDAADDVPPSSSATTAAIRPHATSANHMRTPPSRSHSYGYSVKQLRCIQRPRVAPRLMRAHAHAQPAAPKVHRASQASAVLAKAPIRLFA